MGGSWFTGIRHGLCLKSSPPRLAVFAARPPERVLRLADVVFGLVSLSFMENF